LAAIGLLLALTYGAGNILSLAVGSFLGIVSFTFDHNVKMRTSAIT
jgi:hypothetical protein